MSVAYRSHVAALEARRDTLRAELADARARSQGADEAREAERALLERVNRSDRVRRPLLDTLKVATPCSVKWEEMSGDERSRFCASCEKSVHNLSALTRPEAEDFLQGVRDRLEKPCVNFYRRRDGTILTEDCPVGLADAPRKNRKNRKKLVVLAATAGVLTVALATAYAALTGTEVVHRNAGGAAL